MLLIGMAYSPWSMKAKWSLAHHQLPYKYKEHLLIFGMPELRLRLRRFRGDVTVPALVDGRNRMFDSLEISRYADKIGKGSRLFPEKNLAEIQRINQMSEDVACAARALLLHRLAESPEAQAESLPSFFPKPLRPLFRFLTRIGMMYIRREFRISPNQRGRDENLIHDSLNFLRAMLSAAKGDYLLGEFSYADIAMASVVHCIAPYPTTYMKSHPAVARAWTNDELKTKFRDLVEWRDRIYASNRGPD